MVKVGEHITVDIIGTNKEYDPSIYEKVIKDIASTAKVTILNLSLIHISEPTRHLRISYAVFCLKKKTNYQNI